MTIGKRLYWSVLSLFVIFAVLFIVFQQTREKEFKIDMLNLRLQDYNERMHESLGYIQKFDEESINSYVSQHSMPNLRVTIVMPDGKVVFDNKRKDYDNIHNHGDRKEIRTALKQGKGHDISRASNTLSGDYFYSATFFADRNIIIRSALPYNNDLAQQLQADLHYFWFAIAVVLLLSVILYRFISRLDSHIEKLRLFARRADNNESLDTEELIEFPNDELGEISEYIIKIYKRLQRTKEEQNKLKRQLTQNIAHELKTPVASIQGYIETILHNPNISEENREMFLERSYAQTQRLTSLLTDISTLNRLDDAPELMAFEPIDIAQMVAQIERETALDMKKRDMRLTCKLPSSLPINGNPSMIYSIFRNLTDNAIAYAGDGTTITIDSVQEDDKWTFTFSDNGVGVESKHLDRLFERFYRIDKGRSRKMGGTGLGLAIVKNAVILHGGTITAYNNEKGGLRFVFSLKTNDTDKQQEA